MKWCLWEWQGKALQKSLFQKQTTNKTLLFKESIFNKKTLYNVVVWMINVPHSFWHLNSWSPVGGNLLGQD